MKTKFFDPPRLFLLCLCMLSISLRAQTSLNPTNSGTSTITYKVIDSKKVHAGDHVITLNRVVQPVLPKPAPTAVPPPTPPLTPDQLRAEQAWEAKTHKWVMMEATIYDHQTTEVRLYDSGQLSLRAFSNIDFSSFKLISDIETADTIYEYWIMVLDVETGDYLQGDSAAVASLANARKRLPKLQTSPGSKSSYFIAETTNSQTVTNDGIAALNALHSYYDANHVALIADYQKCMADYAAQQQYLKNHPLIPPNTVTNFWKIKK